MPLTLRLDASKPDHILQAARILQQGGTVAFPTETVYGLGANALSAKAVEQIFVAKQRPHWDPLIVHIAHSYQLPQIASLSPAEARLMAAFWPGPLTLLLPRTPAIPDAVTAGRPLVGVRIPAHPVAQALLRAAGVPVAAPSANTFGHTSPTTSAHVLADLDGRIDAVLDGGPTSVGLESTVAQVVPGGILVYRPGAVSLDALGSMPPGLGWVRLYEPAPQSNPPESLPSPGVGIRHYAPRARLVLVIADEVDPTHSLLDELGKAKSHGMSAAAMLPDGWGMLPQQHYFPWGPWHSPEILAQRLYTGLRELDDRGSQLIVCPLPTSLDGISLALRDRLQKAAREA